MNKNSNPLFEVSDEKLKQIFVGVMILREMNLELIRMYEKESALKKSHKAYLHVREKAEEMCKRNKVLVPKIADAVMNLTETTMPNESITDPFFISIMKGLGMSLPDEQVEDPFDSAKCKGCFRYDDCEEYFMQLRAQKREEAKDKAQTEVKAEQDTFDLPTGMVMMSTGTLGVMQDDMLQMTESLEQVSELLKRGVSGRTVMKEEAQKVANHCAKLSREVFNRWDDADFISIA